MKIHIYTHIFQFMTIYFPPLVWLLKYIAFSPTEVQDISSKLFSLGALRLIIHEKVFGIIHSIGKMLLIWHRTEGRFRLTSFTPGFGVLFIILYLFQRIVHIWYDVENHELNFLQLASCLNISCKEKKGDKSTLNTRNADFLYNVIYYPPIGLSCLD